MTRNYKTNWQGKRTSTRFPVTFDAPKIASEVKEACTICGGEIEECPMMRGVCYSCYRDIIGKEEHKAMQIVLDVTAPKNDPALQSLNKAAGYDVVTAICTKSPERKEWEAQYLAKRAAHVEKYWSSK